MSAIHACALPEQALLGRYACNGAYADCYSTDMAGSISHAKYVEAFYTTTVFKLERLILAWFFSKPSANVQARQLGGGTLDSFAAWHVEDRNVDQLLMCDFMGRTRSWLMVAPILIDGAPATRLYFGSAVVPVVDRSSGQAALGFRFRALLGFHKLYSKILLRAARSSLARSRNFRR